MKCVLNSKILSNLVDGIRDMVKCVNVDCSADGMYMQCLDSAHIALCSFLLSKDGFVSYECLRPVTLGVNLDALRLVLKQASGTVELESHASVLRISCVSEEKKCTFDLKLVDMDMDNLGIPEVEYAYVVHLPSAEFVRTCGSSFGDTMEISVNSEIQFTSKGDHGSSSVSYGGVVRHGDGVSLEFSSRYLSFFAKGASLSKVVVLSMSPDIPLRVEFGFEGGHMQYFLAPKIVD